MRVSEPDMRDRSTDTMGWLGSKRTVEGPSKRPARSPRTRRPRAWATSRPSAVSWATLEPAYAVAGSWSDSTIAGSAGVLAPLQATLRAASRAVRSTGRNGRPSGEQVEPSEQGGELVELFGGLIL